jgi:hypothetical protein
LITKRRGVLSVVCRLALLVLVCVNVCDVMGAESIDDARVAAAGIRKLESRHLVLYTDLPAAPAIDSLPALFDQAVPVWAAYFGVDPARTTEWLVRGFLIRDRAKFESLGLLPADRELVHGYATGSDIWVLDQSTDYYRRHLLLHEGTHAFMTKFLGGCGPGWYSEGMAELLATHRKGAGGRAQGVRSNNDEVLELGIMPRDRQEVPMLGRIKLVRDSLAADRARTIPQILTIDNRTEQLDSETYAWCWALAKFLDSHPRYQARFRGLQKHVQDPGFNALVKREFAADWTELLAEWQAYVTTLDHGYDFQRMAIEFERGTPMGGRPREVTIAADRGWQSSGVLLEGGKSYQITARGRYQIARETLAGVERAWPSEPGGVTIEYQDDRPLGMLLGAIVSEAGGGAGFARPLAIGLGAKISPDVSGTLYLRVNDSGARLDDNRGALTIRIAD